MSKKFKWDQSRKYVISPQGDELEWCYLDVWLNDFQSDVDQQAGEIEKLQAELKSWEETAEIHAKAMQVLEDRNSELKRKLEVAKEIDTRILSYLVDHFLMQAANSGKAGMSVEIAIQHFGVDMIKAEMRRRNPTPLVQWATKYLTEIGGKV